MSFLVSRFLLLAWRQLGFYLILIVQRVLFGNLAIRCLNCNGETAFWRRFKTKAAFLSVEQLRQFEGDTNLEIVVRVASCSVQ